MATNIPAPDDDTMDSTSTPSGNGKPTKAGRNSKGKGRERREVQALLERGRVKGFLTYDEVNDALPPEMVTSEQIDDLMVWLGNEDIEVVDQASQVKRRPEAQKVKTPTLPPAASEDAYAAKSNDPVRMYLRKMGSVSLLTREGEVEIAKRIEAGDMRVFDVLLNSRAGIAEIVEMGDALKKQRLRIKDVVKDVAKFGDPNTTATDDEVRDAVVRIVDKVRRLEAASAKIREELARQEAGGQGAQVARAAAAQEPPRADPRPRRDPVQQEAGRPDGAQHQDVDPQGGARRAQRAGVRAPRGWAQARRHEARHARDGGQQGGRAQARAQVRLGREDPHGRRGLPRGAQGAARRGRRGGAAHRGAAQDLP
jgi:hypothetical protein